MIGPQFSPDAIQRIVAATRKVERAGSRDVGQGQAMDRGQPAARSAAVVCLSTTATGGLYPGAYVFRTPAVTLPAAPGNGPPPAGWTTGQATVGSYTRLTKASKDCWLDFQGSTPTANGIYDGTIAGVNSDGLPVVLITMGSVSPVTVSTAQLVPGNPQNLIASGGIGTVLDWSDPGASATGPSLSISGTNLVLAAGTYMIAASVVFDLAPTAGATLYAQMAISGAFSTQATISADAAFFSSAYLTLPCAGMITSPANIVFTVYQNTGSSWHAGVASLNVLKLA